MALAKKDSIKIPELESEVVDVPELGGEVEVRGLLLRDRLAIAAKTQPGLNIVALYLEPCVRLISVDPEGVHTTSSLMTAEQWEVWGGANDRHLMAATKLWGVARRLCGMDREAVEKKSESPEASSSSSSPELSVEQSPS